MGIKDAPRERVESDVRIADMNWTLRQYLGDGNFGGRYQRADEEMLDLWQVAVDETRALLTGSWGEA
jgi:hypothetical protein